MGGKTKTMNIYPQQHNIAIQIKVTEGYLNQGNKRAIRAILEHKMTEGRVGRTNYFIQHKEGTYTVAMRLMETRTIGAEPKLFTYWAKFKVIHKPQTLF